MVGNWKIIERVKDKDDDWTKYSDGKGNVIDKWRYAPNHWNVTINGSFIIRKTSKGQATKSAEWYMKRHPSGGSKNNPNW